MRVSNGKEGFASQTQGSFLADNDPNGVKITHGSWSLAAGRHERRTEEQTTLPRTSVAPSPDRLREGNRRSPRPRLGREARHERPNCEAKRPV
jgi:hypothetical protein